jgi:hypothetical protein
VQVATALGIKVSRLRDKVKGLRVVGTFFDGAVAIMFNVVAQIWQPYVVSMQAFTNSYKSLVFRQLPIIPG